MKNIDHLLLTGGTGFFGRALLRLIYANSDRPKITILSRNPERFISQYPELANLAEWIVGDITKAETLKLTGSFSHVLHAAYDASREHTLQPGLQHNQIVNGTKNILRIAADSQAARFLFVSSGAIYGPQPQWLERIPESYTGNAKTLPCADVYSIAKYEAEQLCVEYGKSHKFATVIARCFAFVGIDMSIDGRYAIGNFIRDATFNKEILVNGPPDVVRSYLDQEDLAIWLLQLLINGRSGQAYNVGSDQSVTIGALAETVRYTIAPDKQIRFTHPKDSEMPTRTRYVPDVSLAKAELNLAISVPLAEAIRRVGKYLTNNGPTKNFGLK